MYKLHRMKQACYRVFSVKDNGQKKVMIKIFRTENLRLDSTHDNAHIFNSLTLLF